MGDIGKDEWIILNWNLKKCVKVESGMNWL
jgi:hypothetical protein